MMWVFQDIHWLFAALILKAHGCRVWEDLSAVCGTVHWYVPW